MGLVERIFRSNTVNWQGKKGDLWHWCMNTRWARDEKDRFIVATRRWLAETAVEGLRGVAVRSRPSGRRKEDMSKAAVERRRLFLQTRLQPEADLIGQATVSRAAAKRGADDAPDTRNGGCGRIQAAVHAAGIGAGTR